MTDSSIYRIRFRDSMCPVPGSILIPLVDAEFQHEFSDPKLFVTKQTMHIVRIADAPFLRKRYERTRICIAVDPLDSSQSYEALSCRAAYQYHLPRWRPLDFSERGTRSAAYTVNFVRAYMSNFIGICLSNIADRLNEKIRMAITDGTAPPRKN